MVKKKNSSLHPPKMFFIYQIFFYGILSFKFLKYFYLWRIDLLQKTFEKVFKRFEIRQQNDLVPNAFTA